MPRLLDRPGSWRQRFAMRWRRRWRHQAERGAIATLVLVLLGGGALTGAGALAIDVSQLYVEREELQSGADAAAQALAKKCAVSPSTYAAQATTAKSYADTNAKDEHVIYLHDPHDADPDSGLCAKGPGGTTAPGGFGYLDADAGTCMATGSVPSTWDGPP